MAQHRWEKPRLVSVEVGDSPAAWERAGFLVSGSQCNIGGVLFHLTGSEGSRGVSACTFEAETPLARPGETVTQTINGLTYHLQCHGDNPDLEAVTHPNGVCGIQKLEICPVESWNTLTQLVHRVLPPPYQAFAWKNPNGDPQHVALWRMHNMEVFEMADAMGQEEKDEMAMFFLVVEDLNETIATIGKDNCSDKTDMGPDRKGTVLSMKKLDLSVRTFLVEPPPPAENPGE